MNDVEERLTQTVQLWILRMCGEPQVEKRLIGEWSPGDIGILNFLGLNSIINPEVTKFSHRRCRQELETLRTKLEKRRQAGHLPRALERNIEDLAGRARLTASQARVLSFLVVLQVETMLQNTLEWIGIKTTGSLCRMIARALAMDEREVRRALREDGRLIKSGLVEISGGPTRESRLPNFFSPEVAGRLLSPSAEPGSFIRQIVRPSPPPQLSETDYPHLGNRLTLLKSYLREALKQGTRGVNVLIFGIPGTGKTQLTQVLARHLRCTLYTVHGETWISDCPDAKDRLRALRIANNLIAGRALLCLEEADHMFPDRIALFNESPLAHKAWLNEMLESNSIPTIWVCNEIGNMHPAVARRFSLTLQVPVPPREVRQRYISRACAGIAREPIIQRLSDIEELCPALIASAAQVLKTAASGLPGKQQEELLETMLTDALKLQQVPPSRRPLGFR